MFSKLIVSHKLCALNERRTRECERKKWNAFSCDLYLYHQHHTLSIWIFFSRITAYNDIFNILLWLFNGCTVLLYWSDIVDAEVIFCILTPKTCKKSELFQHSRLFALTTCVFALVLDMLFPWSLHIPEKHTRLWQKTSNTIDKWTNWKMIPRYMNRDIVDDVLNFNLFYFI